MRKRGWFAIALAFCLLLAGCGNSSADAASEADKESQTQTQTEAAEGSGTPDEGKEKNLSSEETPSESDTADEAASDAASAGNGYPVFDFNSKTVTLNSGYEMPMARTSPPRIMCAIPINTPRWMANGISNSAERRSSSWRAGNPS